MEAICSQSQHVADHLCAVSHFRLRWLDKLEIRKYDHIVAQTRNEDAEVEGAATALSCGIQMHKTGRLQENCTAAHRDR